MNNTETLMSGNSLKLTSLSGANIDIAFLTKRLNKLSDEQLRFIFSVIVASSSPNAIATITAERIVNYIRTGNT